MTLGPKLKTARQAANLTQEAVAQQLFVTRQAISRWEQDKTLPNIYVLQDLGQLYQVDVQYFLGQTAEDTPRKRVNIWALIGIITFNVFFLSTAGMFLIFIFLLIWTYILFFLILPLASLQNGAIPPIYLLVTGQAFTPSLWLTLTLFAVSLSLLPIASLITRQLWQLTRRYVRYNLKSIYTY